MIYAFSSGEYSFGDSSEYIEWSDIDGLPVSARNYAEHQEFDDTEYIADVVRDVLDTYFPGGWDLDDHEKHVVVATNTTEIWPFVVRRRVVFTEKYYGERGYAERPFTELSNLLSQEMVTTGEYGMDCI